MKERKFRSRPTIIILAIAFIICTYLFTSYKCNVKPYFQKLGDISDLPIIYAVTPTYARPVQKAELNRLSHIILLVPNIHWIIVEDANQTSTLVEKILLHNELMDRSVLLYSNTPEKHKHKLKDPNWVKPRGVEQRNIALEWIRSNVKINPHSIVYFMDDDNTYSLELFREISKIKPGEVGVWPVGLVGGLKVEKPILNSQNKVIGFNAAWRPERPFPIDMAGFAISTDLLLQRREAVFSYEVQRGFQESEILRHLTTLEKLRPLANFCHDVLVWHTRTEKPNLGEEEKLSKKGKRSDEGMEV